jgi:aryl-alcohol dehydrogenase-like predicted oxidoreductase
MEQFDASLRALEIKLSAEQLAAIEAIFPGNKTHPEHYAW